MIFRNGVEIKKINEEFSRLNLLLGEMKKTGVSRTELINMQSQVESGLLKIATYMDKIDKVWVNKGKMRSVYTDYNTLISSYNQAKLQIARAGHTVDYSSTDDLWMRSEDRIKSNVSYLNNANNSRTKDRIHYFATRGLGLVLAGALIAGSWTAIGKYNDMKNDYSSAITAGETLEDENKTLQDANKVLEEENKALQEEIKGLEGQIAILEGQLEEAKKNNNTEEVERLTAEIESLKEQLKETVSLKEYNDLLSQYNKSQEELEKAKAEIKSLTEQLKNASSSTEEATLRAKIAELEAKVTTLEGKLSNYETVIAENEQLRADKAGLESSLQSANERIADLEKQLEEAKNANDADKIKNLEEQLAEANNVKAQLESSLSEANKKIGNLEKTIAELNKENDELEKENEELKQDNLEGNALMERVDSMYAEVFGNDGAGKTPAEKLDEIVEVLTEDEVTNDGSALREAAITIIVNTYYLPYSEVSTWTDQQLIDKINAIYGELAQPGDGSTNENVNEETTPSTPTTPDSGETTPGDGEISPDYDGIIHE